jgi:phosphatidate phosphatase APP1
VLNSPARFLVSAVLLTSCVALAGPAVLLTPVIGRSDSVVIQGRVLKEAPSKGSSVLSRNLRRLTAPHWEGARVEVSFLGASAAVTSGDDGAFEVTLQPPEGASFPAGFHVAEAKVAGASARARVQVVADSTPFLVISDFDDTLAISQVTKRAKLLENALFKDSDSQAVVPGMAAFYGCLKAPTAPAFALVSGSPVQFGLRVNDFLGRHGFPAFGVYLRDLGPSTLSNYKQPIIRRLLRQFPQPVVLVGDSGEKDPEIYAQIRDEFPGRVKAIYIRDAGHAEDSSRFKDMLLFQKANAAAEHAGKNGLADAACVASAFPESAPTVQTPTP